MSTKLKRKKKVNSCPNPLFAQWLTEWRDSAAEKGIKTQYAYGKALAALKKYPIPLHSGKAAKILDNFGDKICNMLDKKLEEHMASQVSESSATVLDLDADSDDYEMAVPTPTRKRKATPGGSNKRGREYIPLHRSGPYSLIIALYRNYSRPFSKGYMNKIELQDAAQPLCDTSMKIPEPGSHYTAWSSMSTLISKGFVIKEGNPARYVITESGCTLAEKIEAAGVQQVLTGTHTNSGACTFTVTSPTSQNSTTSRPSANSRPSTASRPDSDHQPKKPFLDDIIPLEEEYRRTDLTSKGSISNVPSYWYINDEGQEVTLKDRAAVTINGSGVGFLIKCYESSLRCSSLCYEVERDKSAPAGWCYAYLHNDDAAEVCPASQISSGVQEPKSCVRIADDSKKSSVNYPDSKPTNSLHSSTHIIPSMPHSTASKTNHRLASEKTVSGAESKGPSIDIPDPLFTLRPGHFDVILCVDNCETTGIGGREGKGRKHILLKELQKNGVNLDVRKLQVGDFLWVAREKGNAIPGMLQMPQRREAVLDYVVERKRMDDLSSSIQDGRFKEQKFRLKQCGLGHPIYLVEEFGSADHLSIPASTLQQSAVNTQVIDGFFVKNTRDSKESAAYLTIMTRYLNSMYMHKTIKAYGREDMLRLGDSAEKHHDQECCLSFPEFNESSVKNKEMTVTEIFAKQLLQFSGMTAEKAFALTQLYKTPSDLLRAYESCRLPSDQEKMLAKVKYGHSQRNIGPALSKVVYQLYCSSKALT